MGQGHLSDQERADRAEKRLMEIPYDQLGPAGRILVDNPRPSTPEQRRAGLRQVECSGSGEVTDAQLRLMGSVGDGG